MVVLTDTDRSCRVEFAGETFDGGVGKEGQECVAEFKCTDDPDLVPPPLPTETEAKKK